MRQRSPEPQTSPRLETRISSLPSGDHAGREVLVELRVVVARQAAVPVLGDADGLARRRAVGAGRRARRRGTAPRRPSRRTPPASRRATSGASRFTAPLATRAREVPSRSVEHPQLQRVVAVGRVEDAASVRRPVRLRVVARSVGELDGVAGADPLAPERALHRVDELLPVGGPRRIARAACNLRQVHLSVVVGVRLVDLLEDREALGEGGGRGEESGDQSDQRVGAGERRRESCRGFSQFPSEARRGNPRSGAGNRLIGTFLER